MAKSLKERTENLQVTQEKNLATAVAVAEKEKKRSQELKEAYQELQEKTERLEDFQEITVGRELEMLKLMEEVNDLRQEQGRPKKYEETEEIRKKEQAIRRKTQ